MITYEHLIMKWLPPQAKACLADAPAKGRASINYIDKY